MHEQWRLPWDGGCRCGKVRVRITAAPLMTMACHCTGCQTMTASAFSLSVMVPADGLTITAGEPVVGGLHGPDRHMFCAYCMTWMFATVPAMPDYAALMADFAARGARPPG